MKNVFRLALASIVLMVSCSKDNELPTPIQESAKFYASIEAPTTRTSVGEDGKLSWSNDDEITLFSNTYAQQCRYTGESDGKSVFESVSSQVSSATELTANYAIYPYAANTTISNNGEISYTIPATQKYAENSFGLGANVMVAVTKNLDANFLAFKNLGGYFEFSLYGDVTVKSIEFKGNNGEKLAGAATITATNQDAPTFVFADDATETLMLDCGDGVQLGADAENATRFWFVVPAITYSKGITITITDTDGKVMEKLTTNSISIERSTIQPLNAFDVETHDANTPPNNQIWYTTKSGNPISYNNHFGAVVTSNTYVNGKGILSFNGNVTMIGYNAFPNDNDLASIIIPNSVTEIGTTAFDYCNALTSVVLGNGVKSIGQQAFKYCTALTSIVIPDSVNNMGDGVFLGCTALKSAVIGDGVKIINNSMFKDCSALTDVTIGQNVEIIDWYAFQDCTSLANLTLPHSTTSVYGYAFDGCTSLSSLTLSKVEYIGERAFFDCDALSTVTVPSTVSNFGNAAFGSCDNLSEFYGDLASDDHRCLINGSKMLLAYAPKGMTSYTIPDDVEQIGMYAFENCNNLENITTSTDVVRICEGAFKGCNSLTTATIEANVREINREAFYNCTNLKTIFVKNQTPPALGNYTFDNCSNLTTIYVPSESVETYKTNWSRYADKIKAIPQGIND